MLDDLINEFFPECILEYDRIYYNNYIYVFRPSGGPFAARDIFTNNNLCPGVGGIVVCVIINSNDYYCSMEPKDFSGPIEDVTRPKNACFFASRGAYNSIDSHPLEFAHIRHLKPTQLYLNNDWKRHQSINDEILYTCGIK